MRFVVPLVSVALLLPVLGGCASGEGGRRGGAAGSDASVENDAGRLDGGGTGGLDGGPRDSMVSPAMDAGTGSDAGMTECSRDSDCDDGEPCTTDACGPDGRCTRADSPDGTPCNADDDGCTEGDACAAGACAAGAAVSCDDGLPCTTDRCVSTGADTHSCEQVVSAGSCLVDGMCYAAGASPGSNACQVCDPTSDSTAWSDDDGATCNDGDSCTTSDRCSGGACTGTPRSDAYEPNETRGTSHDLGSVSDTASYPRASFTAMLYPAADEDWYRFHDSDDFGGAIYPRVELQNIPAGTDYDLCAYIECDSTFLSLSCTAGNAHTLGGLEGCCSRAAGSASENVRINHDCSGSDDSATVHVRVWRYSGGPSCESYTVRWGDD